MQLIDIGANLTHESFAADLEAVLARAHEQHVESMIVTGASPSGSVAALALAEQYPQLYATCGVHPHEASTWNKTVDEEHRQLSKHTAVVAVGECGLDYYRDFSPRDKQLYAFEAQLNIACDCQKPLFLHQRDAHDDFYKLLSQYRKDINKAVVHCFTGTEEEMLAYLELDCHIGITGWICDERRGHHLRDFIHHVPANRLMIETDAPYLLPRDIRPKPKTRRNEPMWLAHIAEVIASCLGKEKAQLAAETYQTSRDFFNLVESN